MKLKTCPCCKTELTTKNVTPKGRDDLALYFNCNTIGCGSTIVLPYKNWREKIRKGPQAS